MKSFRYAAEKDALLKTKYGFGFEEVIAAISEHLLDLVFNPSRPQQKVFIVWLEHYVYAVPFVENDREYFLKTFYPSRKLNRRYRRGGT